MKTYTLFTTEHVTPDMLAQFHELSQVGNLEPVEMRGATWYVIPDMEWPGAWIPSDRIEGETDAQWLGRIYPQAQALFAEGIGAPGGVTLTHEQFGVLRQHPDWAQVENV